VPLDFEALVIVGLTVLVLGLLVDGLELGGVLPLGLLNGPLSLLVSIH
jgi:hypothetical protein